MKTVKFVPEICKGEEKLFEGDITLRAVTFDERCDYMEKVGLDVAEDGKVETLKGKLQMIRRLVSLSKAHYEAVNLVKVSTGETYTSFDDLTVDQEAYPILNEVGTWLINGLSMGKASKPA